ncbi:DUF808 domain-containing protein [Gulosibacter molinativorax]|uniref:DUF808 domain-containing protein n=1 Tax=Gulosibacter molinativorax TaxID=256821 RepID=A0ABT7C618_9MICO|nr:DUF808 domain-containing protein [Gulosibacter molinativorax]MDJ1370543.1 DUF808 domain-containing protein [Gulosibacter molinativorax]QUY62044.1 Inner membrane protein YedI [Gulosibacter molinativorax]
MAGGFVALLDDIAALARAAAATLDDVGVAAAKASSKAAGVVIDDAAVTPQYVDGLKPERELPIIWKIARGSLFNKIVIILPLALLLSAFVPWLLQPILMLGGAFLCFEGAEKIWEKIHGRNVEQEAPAVAKEGEKDEKQITSGAIRTDLILSAEIMVISLNEVINEPFWNRVIILIVVAIGITALVYGAVALLVKVDDFGLSLMQRDSKFSQRFGKGLVNAMPHVMDVISIVGTFAMLWVGGHLILVGADSLGWHAPYELVHTLSAPAAGIAGIGGFLAWLIDTLCSMILGFIVGSIIVLVAHYLPFGHGKDGHGKDGRTEHEKAADAPATGGDSADPDASEASQSSAN